MATNISDEGLYEHAARAKGQVVVITGTCCREIVGLARQISHWQFLLAGAGNGIGKEAALAFAKNGYVNTMLVCS